MATRRVAIAQARVLMDTVGKNSATAFGREHGFDGIRSVGDYQERVPVRGYEELEPYIERAAAGERRVLTREAVESFALSSGSSASSKLIPYTPSLLGDFRRGITPWLFGLYVQHPSLMFGKSYWQVSPVGAPAGVSPGGIRIGFGEDSEYFGRYLGALVRATLAVPESVAGVADVDTFRLETLRYLLACRNLRFISVWSPSFLALLLADLRHLAPLLIERIRRDGSVGRAVQLERIFDEWEGAEITRRNSCGRTLPEAVWPKLRVISCWCDAGAREPMLHLRSVFPNVVTQPKGLIATEGIMSLPWRAQGAALALRSHFFEFFETDPDNPKLAHELEAGHTYSILLTTSGGLYRYRIGDLVEVTGWIAQCPLLRFCGKESDVSDMVGEKLNGVHVVRAVGDVFARYGFAPAFWMVAPERSQPAPGYVLYIQSRSAVPDGLVSALDAALGENFHYEYARRLGQLAALKLFLIDPESVPEAAYIRAQAVGGQRLGRIKRPLFDRSAGWSKVFRKTV